MLGCTVYRGTILDEEKIKFENNYLDFKCQYDYAHNF